MATSGIERKRLIVASFCVVFGLHAICSGSAVSAVLTFLMTIILANTSDLGVKLKIIKECEVIKSSTTVEETTKAANVIIGILNAL